MLPCALYCGPLDWDFIMVAKINIPASLTHSRISCISSCALTFWMLRCLLVAFCCSSCACCYGSISGHILVRLELAMVSRFLCGPCRRFFWVKGAARGLSAIHHVLGPR